MDDDTKRHRNPSFTAEAIAEEDAELGCPAATASSTDNDDPEDPGSRASSFADATSKRGSIFAERKNRTRKKGKLLVCLSSAALLVATAALVGVVSLMQKQPPAIEAALQLEAQPPAVEAALQLEAPSSDLLLVEIAQLQADFEALQTSHTQLQSDVSASQAERATALDSVRTSVADNTAAIGENDEQLDTHAATLSTHADDIASSETTLTTHGGRLDTHEETVRATVEAALQLEAPSSDLLLEIAALQASHAQLQADFEALQTSHTQLQSDVSASQAERATALDSVRTSVADNTAAIGENDEQLDTHAATLSTHADDIASSETTLTTHGGRLDTHEETIGAHTEQLATHEQSISSNGQRLDEHEPAVPVVESFTIMSATTNARNRGVYERMHDSVSCNGQPVYAKTDSNDRYLFQPDGTSRWRVGSRTHAEACSDNGYLSLTCEHGSCEDLTSFTASPDVTVYHRAGGIASDRTWAGEEVSG